MFEYEEGTRCQNAAVEDKWCHRGELRQVVGRVGKDEVEFFPAVLNEAEHVALDGAYLACAELGGHFAYEVVLYGVVLDRDDRAHNPAMPARN